MPESNSNDREQWLVAAWPGMGNVALVAAGFLVEQLRAIELHELDLHESFEPRGIDVKSGIAIPARLPGGTFFEWNNPPGKRDLLLFIGEAQPPSGGYRLCQRVAEYAASRGVRRLCTFAAMATQLQLGTKPKVLAVATDAALLEQARGAGAQVLEEGKIGGLNGLLLAAGAQRDMAGICLLGELPFFATGVPNPRAAQVVLEVFSSLLEIPIDLTSLKQQADLVEDKLDELVQQLSHLAEQAAMEGEEIEEQTNGIAAPAEEEPEKKPMLDPKIERRIEALFEKAQKDRSQAFELKRELDRLDLFKQYEDRFLDLFRNAE